MLTISIVKEIENCEKQISICLIECLNLWFHSFYRKRKPSSIGILTSFFRFDCSQQTSFTSWEFLVLFQRLQTNTPNAARVKEEEVDNRQLNSQGWWVTSTIFYIFSDSYVNFWTANNNGKQTKFFRLLVIASAYTAIYAFLREFISEERIPQHFIIYACVKWCNAREKCASPGVVCVARMESARKNALPLFCH